MSKQERQKLMVSVQNAEKSTLKKKAKLCCNCKYAGDHFRIKDKGLPHCHCHHKSVKPEDYGWGSLREIFWTCGHFKYKQEGLKNEHV